MTASRIRPLHTAAVAALLCLFLAADADAQWEGSATVSVALQSGVSDSRTLAIAGDATRAVAGGWSVNLQGDHTHASFKIGEDFTTVADSQNVRLSIGRDLNEIVYLVVRPAYKRNEVQGVDHRLEGLAGLGVRVLRGARARLDVLGVGGVIDQDKNVPEVDGTDGVAGVVQTSRFILATTVDPDTQRPVPTWQLSEVAMYLKPFSSDDYRMQFQAALTGTIAGPLALSISYSMDRENIVLGSSENTDRRLNIGVQFNF
jgi:hypothetical protein